MLKPILLPALLPLFFLPACAQGGKQSRPASDVTIAANHHLFGFRSLPGFGAFPVVPESVVVDRGFFNLFDDSTWTITRSSGTSDPDDYAIDNTGVLSVLVTGTGRDPSVVFAGGYGLNGNSTDFFFTDRVSTSGSPSLGLFYGTRVRAGQVELAGAYHLLSLHVMFANSTALLSPDNVARAAHGAVSVVTGDPGTARTLSGTGSESSNATLVFSGSIQNILQSDVGDGSCNLSVTYQVGTNSDTRVFAAAAGLDTVMALDSDETDGSAGMLCLVRKFDAPASPAENARIAGTFLVGGYTVFVNPVNSGTDAFTGTLTLTAQGGLRLDAIGSRGIDFSYTGTWDGHTDGSLTLHISGTNETWFAAIGREYNTLVLVDDVIESRSNGLPELNFAIGVRQKTL